MAPRKHKQNQGQDAPMSPTPHAVQQLQVQQYAAMAGYEVDSSLQAQLTEATQRSETELNMSVLQRYNNEICALEHIAPYGVVYEWVAEQNNWEKSGIEGSVFICKLWPNAESNERYTIMVLNRRQLHNLDFELKSEEDVEFTDQYIILMDQASQAQPKVWGLWIFAEPAPSSTASQPQDVADKVQECLKKAEHSRNSRMVQDTGQANAYPRPSPSPITSANSQHLNTYTQAGQRLASQVSISKSDIVAPASSFPLPQPMFAHSADTAFFRTPLSRAFSAAASQSIPESHETQILPIASHKNHLLSLFRQAED